MTYFHTQPYGELLATMVTFYSLFMTLILIPATSFAILFMSKKKLRNDKIKTTLGVLYEDLKIGCICSKVFFILFIVRRVTFLIYMTQDDEGPMIFKLYFIYFCNYFFSMYYGGLRPYKKLYENRFEIFLEFMIGICTYQLTLFTQWTESIEEASVRFSLISWPMIILVGSWTVICLLMVAYFSLMDMRLVLIRYYRRVKHSLQSCFYQHEARVKKKKVVD